MKIENPGVEFGLKLHLSPQQDLYYGFAAEIAGFKVHIHKQDEAPLIKENGFAVMPGTSTFVAVTIKQVRSARHAQLMCATIRKIYISRKFVVEVLLIFLRLSLLFCCPITVST
jgi:hypothetical protein